MKKLTALLLFMGSFATAQTDTKSYLGTYGLHDVVVPTVWGTPSGGDLIQGMLFYDGNDEALKFVGGSATPITIVSTSGGGVTSTGTERIERGMIVGSNCTLAAGSSGGVSTSGTNLSSNCTLTFSPAFSGAPSCIYTTKSGNTCATHGNTAATSSSAIVTARSCDSGSVGSNTDVYYICMGAR